MCVFDNVSGHSYDAVVLGKFSLTVWCTNSINNWIFRDKQVYQMCDISNVIFSNGHS